MDYLFRIIAVLESFYWQYVGVFLILAAGIYFSIKTKFFQFRVLKHLPSTIKKMYRETTSEQPGLSPLRLFFASAGGMMGIGNIVAIVAAVIIGGPGALFWFWVVSMVGSLIKYSEIYLGMKYRVRSPNGGYDGAIMFAFPKAFKNKYLAAFLMNFGYILLCIYGVEIYQFTVIIDTFKEAMPILHREWLIIGMLCLTFYVALGGIRRLANICSFLMPIFISVYLFVCLRIVFANIGHLPSILGTVLKSAFMGHAPIGGFLGSTCLIAAYQGTAKAVYTADIAIGFDSFINSESRVQNPNHQARVAILATLLNACICTLSILVVLLTGLWKDPTITRASDYIITAVGMYFPYSKVLMAIIIFLAGFKTVQAYLATGAKSARFLHPKWGYHVYIAYAIASLWFFAHFDQTRVLLIMSLSSGLLVLLNLSCILRLRRQICFKLD